MGRTERTTQARGFTMKKFLEHAAEAVLFAGFTIGLGVVLCMFWEWSLVWSPVVGPIALFGLLKAARAF